MTTKKQEMQRNLQKNFSEHFVDVLGNTREGIPYITWILTAKPFLFQRKEIWEKTDNLTWSEILINNQ